MYKPLRFIILLIVFIKCAQVNAQIPNDTIPAKIISKQSADSVLFKSELRELRQIAGAPEPFYTYFWEFGDGNFSYLKEPSHIYADTGIYHPRLYATNNYDDGKPPPRRPGTVIIKQKPNTKLAAISPAFFKPGQQLGLKTNNMPKPNEEMVLIIGYRNNSSKLSSNKSGTIALFYNDKEFDKDNFKIEEVRLHHNEIKKENTTFLNLASVYKQSFNYYASKGPNNPTENFIRVNKSELVKERLDKFRNLDAWTYNNLENERFMFLSLKTTPEMLKDTNAVVNISALMLPDDPFGDIEVFDLELQIVASHDPNKMVLKNRKLNYRFTGKNKTLTYKVYFQNTGKGPAKTVNIGVNIPEVFDKNSLKVIKTQPHVLLKDSTYQYGSVLDTIVSKDSANFIFRNIYLPGTKQDGVNDPDSTKGFVEYSLSFLKKPKKTPFKSSASIIFDKNEPIYTNKSVGKFKPGLSPGVITGFGFLTNTQKNSSYGNKNYALGFTISPYSPYKKYLQAEIFISSYNQSNEFLGAAEDFKAKDTVFNNRDGYLITGREFYSRSQNTTVELVPLQLRYNINNYIGIGAGAIIGLSIKQKGSNYQNSFLEQRQNGTIVNAFTDEKLLYNFNKSFTNFKSAGFIDMQLGLVRKGPALGIRYIHSINVKDQRIFTYLSWKI